MYTSSLLSVFACRPAVAPDRLVAGPEGSLLVASKTGAHRSSVGAQRAVGGLFAGAVLG